MRTEMRFRRVQQLFEEQRRELANLQQLLLQQPDARQGASKLEMTGFFSSDTLKDFLPSLIPFTQGEKTARDPYAEMKAASVILRAWRNFRLACEEHTAVVGPSAMARHDGFYLFAFRLGRAGIRGRLEIGFTQHAEISRYNFRQNVQFVSSSGLAFQGGRSQRILGAREFFATCQAGDVLTLAVTEGVGLLTVLNDRTGLVMQGPLGIELPILGEVFPVLRASDALLETLDSVEPRSVPLINPVTCNHEWITSGPLLPGSVATLEICDLEEACCLGFTTAAGAAACAARVPVKPIWQMDFLAEYASETTDHRRTRRKFAIGNLDLQQRIVVTHHGDLVTVQRNGALVHQFQISEQHLFIIAEGLDLVGVDYD